MQRQNLLERLATGAVLALASCSSAPSTSSIPSNTIVSKTQYQRPSISAVVPGHNYAHELRRVTNKDSEYDLGGIVINGRSYYEQNNPLAKEDELSTLLVARDEHLRIIDPTTQEVRIESAHVYIPTRVRNFQGNRATRVPLTSKGEYGIRADLTTLNTRNVQAGIFKEDENNQRFKILTITLKTGEFYVPRASDIDLQTDSLPFYMIPVIGTNLEVAPSRNITLVSPQGDVYRPLQVKREDYKKRKAMQNPKPENQSGQAETPR